MESPANAGRFRRKIIITTVRICHLLEEIGATHSGRRFAIVIDEAHSSQGGTSATTMGGAPSNATLDEDEDGDDIANKALQRHRGGPRMLDGCQVYSAEQVELPMARFLANAHREGIDAVLSACRDEYEARLDEDGLIDLKGKVKAFTST